MSIVDTSALHRCPILSSERVEFQRLDEEDVGKISYLLSNYETVLLLTYAPWPYEVSDAIEWMNHVNQMCLYGRGCFWGLHDINDAFVGTAGLSIFPEHDKAEIHYWLGKQYWGKGYGTEVARRVTRYAFEDLHLERVEVNHMSRNFRSQRVIEKNGFMLEGTFRNYIKRFGEYEDVKFYSLLRKDYKLNDTK